MAQQFQNYFDEVTKLAEWVIDMEQKLKVGQDGKMLKLKDGTLKLSKDSKMREVKMDMSGTRASYDARQTELCERFSKLLKTIESSLESLKDLDPSSDKARENTEFLSIDVDELCQISHKLNTNDI